MKRNYSLDDLASRVGQELGVSSWLEVDQAKIDAFAACTGDHQWIHVDVDRARRESPFGSTIAHGYLTLSMVVPLAAEIGALPRDAETAINYGLDKVRFVNPVKAGRRVRLRCALTALEERGPGTYLMRCTNTMEIEDEAKPALIAEMLVMLYERRTVDA